MVNIEAVLVIVVVSLSLIVVAEAELTNESYVDTRSRSESLGYGFFRDMVGTGPSRRVFGGTAARLAEWPGTCVLADRGRGVRCTGSIVGPRWVITAAHCLSPHLALVLYGTAVPRKNASVAVILHTFQHPRYEVDQRSGDVSRLQHDVGLVSTRENMDFPGAPVPAPAPALDDLRTYDLSDLYGQEVQVLGFGRTERSVQGEELMGARLRLARCGRHGWRVCVCGAAPGPASRGVCSGDSGGPVIYRGHLVGVTSMGPLECSSPAAETLPGLTSVFTSLHPYVDIISATVHHDTTSERMQQLSAAPHHLPLPLLLALVLLPPR